MDDKAMSATTVAAAVGPVFVYKWLLGPSPSQGFPAHDDSARFHWVHADRRAEPTRTWIDEHPAIPAQARQALLEEDTRPRVETFNDGLLVILRAVELTPGEDPDELVSLRMWLDDKRLISLRSKQVKAPAQLRDRIDQGLEVQSSAQLLIELCAMITVNLGELIEDIGERVGELEEQTFEGSLIDHRESLARLRRRIVSFRRHMAPQAFALSRLQECGMSEHEHHLRELENRTQRINEELHQLAERGQLLQGVIGDVLNEQVDQRMRLLTVLGAIFLPLSFLTGLLGINVGGIPGTDSDYAFLIVCLAMLVLLIMQLIWLRWRKWI